MSHRLKVTIKNASDYALTVADDAEETVLKPPSLLATGSNPLPTSIAAKPATPPTPPTPPVEDCNFTIETPIDGPTPEGSIVLQFDALQLRVGLSWTDYSSALKDGDFSSILAPCSWTEERLDGAVGDVEITIEYFDKDKKRVQFEDLTALDARIKQTQKELVRNGLKDPRYFPAVPMYPIEARFTVNVRVPATIGTAPTRAAVTMPATSVRPTGSSKIVTGSQFPTWDTPGLSRRRKKLLAAIGSCFPMHYAPKAGDRERQSRDPSKNYSGDDPKTIQKDASNIPYLGLPGWSPGSGTSCTSVSTLIEGILTGHKGKWGFTAPFFEDSWVPWGASPTKPMPNVGDVYLLFNDVAKGSELAGIGHVGFILQVPKDESEMWVTAEGGQLGIHGRPGEHGGAAYLSLRMWTKRRPIDSKNVQGKLTDWKKTVNALLYAKPIVDVAYPYLIGGYESKDSQDARRLIGWIDIDSPTISFLSEEFDGPMDVSLLKQPVQEIQQRTQGGNQLCTEADFRFLGAWINKMLRLDNNLDEWIAHLDDPEKNAAPVRRFSPWGQDC